MSNAIPMALRPAARIASPWHSVTRAVLQRYSTPPPCFTRSTPSLVLAALQSHSRTCQNRAFSTTPRTKAKAHDPPEDVPSPPAPPLPQRQRAVKIGPLPNGPVDEGTVRRIFGSRVSLVEGNQVLRILHHRRTSGSLADYGVDNLGLKFQHISRETAINALEWLRNRYPIDEARAAEEWAEKEANRIAYELWLADPENESKYKDPARVFREQQKKKKEEEDALAASEGEQYGTQRIGMLHVGPSQFERNIVERRQQRLAAATKKAEEKEAREKDHELKLATGEWVRTPSGTQLMKPGQEAYVDIFGREVVSNRKEEEEKARKKAMLPHKTLEETLAQTTLAQRLYPMTALVLLVCLVSYGYAHYYIPPSPEYRLWPELSLTTATISALVLSKLVIAVAWRIPILWPFMTRYFMHVPAYPRAVQSVLNVFSHVQFDHLVANLMVFLLVGPVCHELVGRGTFIGTYISAGAIGTLASLYWANLGRGQITAHSVGASAAIWGIAALYCVLTDQNTAKIPFVKDLEVSVYPKLVFAAFVVMEILSARRGKSPADHASHFGGMITGLGVAAYMLTVGDFRRGSDAPNPQVEAVKQPAAADKGIVDVEAIVKEEAKEIKEAVKKAVKKE